MKFLGKPRRQATPELVGGAVVVGAAIAVLTWKLPVLVKGAAAVESQLQPLRAAVTSLWDNPVNLGQKLAEIFVTALSPHGGITTARLGSVLLALATIGLMYWLLVRWYGVRNAVIGGLLTATATWFLHAGRLATPDSIYMLAIILILAMSSLWHQTNRPRWLLYASAIIGTILLYSPGVIWLLGALIFIERDHIWADIRSAKTHALGAGALTAALLAPMVHTLIHNWHIAALYLGVPTHAEPLQLLKQIAVVWPHIFIKGPIDPARNLADLPLLTIFTTVMFLLGLYLFVKHRGANRSRLLLALWLIGTLLVGLGLVPLVVLLPPVLMVATGGIGYFLQLWLKTFPRNPLARWFGFGLIWLLLSLAMLFNLRSYFIAWPHAPETRATFVQRR